MTVNAEEVQPTKEETGDASDIAKTSADSILYETTPEEVTPAETTTPADDTSLPVM